MSRKGRHCSAVEQTYFIKDKTIKKLYGWGRVTYLIDKTGVIRFVQKGDPKNQDFIKKLNQLQ